MSVGNLSKTTLSGLQDQAAVQSGSNKSSQQDALSAGPHRTTNEGQGAPLPGATSVECHVTLHNVATCQGDAAGSAKASVAKGSAVSAKGAAPTGAQGASAGPAGAKAVVAKGAAIGAPGAGQLEGSLADVTVLRGLKAENLHG